MAPVLPIDTQRYQSGDYILEVTAYPSSLSQWSDRTVVRQLRFNLWKGQQRLMTGDQHQLIAMSNAVETYVHTHLNQQTWPQIHRLELLGRDINLSTLQLFNLAEVLNACGQRQMTLPARRRRRPWWTGSAAASLLVAAGVTTVYLYYRPVEINQVATSQAPEAAFENDSEAEPTIPGARSAPAASSVEQAPVDEGLDSSNPDSSDNNEFKTAQDLAQRPLDTTSLESVEETPSADSQPLALEPGTAAGADGVSPDPVDPAVGMSEIAEAPVSPPAPSEDIPATLATEQGESFEVAADELRSQPEEQIADDAADNFRLLAAIATQLAPYQPIDIPYPLVYRLQIAPDGTILSSDPITENAPLLEIPEDARVDPPGRPLQLTVTYTGAVSPTVNER